MEHFTLILTQTANLSAGNLSGKIPFGHWELEGRCELFSSGDSVIDDFPTDNYRIHISLKKIKIQPILFSIFPIYYCSINNRTIISSSINKIKECIGTHLTINKKFLLEQILFNYSFSNSTIYNEIKLLPSNTSVEISDKVELKKILTIEDHFVESPNDWRGNLEDLVDLFIEVNKNSIRNGNFISFTGGFDGRSLVALGKYFGRDFNTYSFGNESNDDLTLPRSQAKQLGIPFTSINLDEKYINDFWDLGTKLITEHNLNTNLAQVHWYYCARVLSKYTDTAVTGIFGSELFRTFHLPGQFISRHIINLINTADSKNWINLLKSSPELKFINIENFKFELEEILQEAIDYKSRNSKLSKNHLLYKFGYEESFRKFFGNQFVNPMSNFINVKTPYLNWKFMKELLGSHFSGVNNDFMTNNPLKRFKGQQFYAELIKKTFPKLLTLKTNKGYAPGDLLSILGIAKITKSFIIKRVKRKYGSGDLNNLSILSALQKHSQLTENLNYKEYYNSIFRKELLCSGLMANNELLRNKYLEIISQLVYLNIIERKS